jgi:hypothetical protein
MNLNEKKYYRRVFLEVLMTCRNPSYDTPSWGQKFQSLSSLYEAVVVSISSGESSLDVSHILSHPTTGKKDDMSDRI